MKRKAKDKLHTVSQAAREIGVPENTLRKWVRDKLFGENLLPKERVNKRDNTSVLSLAMVERGRRFKQLKNFLPCVDNENIVHILNLEDEGNFSEAEEILRDYAEELTESVEMLRAEADRLHALRYDEP
jgi:hypothetical protein